MTSPAPRTVERAFELAPECETMNELRAKLAKEGCANVDAHIQGSLSRQLSRLLKA